MKDLGYHINVFIPKTDSDIDEFAGLNQVIVMTYYNNKYDLYDQLHTVAIGRSKMGYRAYNVYGNGQSHGYFKSLSSLVKALGTGNAAPIILVGINEERVEK